MVIDAETQREIEKKGAQFDAARDHIIQRIQKDIESVMNRLNLVKEELVREAEAEFGVNPFFCLYSRRQPHRRGHQGNPVQRNPKQLWAQRGVAILPPQGGRVVQVVEGKAANSCPFDSQ